LSHRAARLASAIVSFISPIDALFHPERMAENAATIQDKSAELAHATAGMATQGYFFAETLPKFAGLAREIRTNYEVHRQTLNSIALAVGVEDKDSFTAEMAQQFLENHVNYSPAITMDQLVRYKDLLSQMVENCCDVLTRSSGVVKESIRASVTKMCPTTLQRVAIFKDLLETQGKLQLEAMNGFVSFARERMSAEAVTRLSEQMWEGSSLKKLVAGAVSRKSAQFVLQSYRTDLVNHACNVIEYTNHGKKPEFCGSLTSSTSDLGPLVSHDFNRDSLCASTNIVKGVFKIPAKARKFRETLPAGTVDLNQLYDRTGEGSSTFFQIPGAHWLADQGWIRRDEVNDGPFYVKRLQLFPLPTFSSSQESFTSQFTLIANRNGDVSIPFDKNVSSTFSYVENENHCAIENQLISPYGDKDCLKSPDLCMKSDGSFPGPVYPLLTSSLWKIDIKLPANFRQKLLRPVNEFNLRVEAEICYRRRSFPGMHSGSEQPWIKTAVTTSLQTPPPNPDCCATYLKYYDESRDDCASCPGSSIPRLNGHYCETCPVGFEPDGLENEDYGCRPCPVEAYKSVEGNDRCSYCEPGKTTHGTVGNAFCFA